MTGRGYRLDRVIVNEPFVSPEAYADDGLIDALITARLGDDTELVLALLAEWRREIHGQPVPELVGIDQAAEVIRAAQRALR